MQPREAEWLHSAAAPPSLQLIAFCRNLHQPAAAHYKTNHSALTLHAFLSGSHPSGAFKQYPELEIRAESQPSLLGSISSGKKISQRRFGCRASLCGSLRCFLCAESCPQCPKGGSLHLIFITFKWKLSPLAPNKKHTCNISRATVHLKYGVLLLQYENEQQRWMFDCHPRKITKAAEGIQTSWISVPAFRLLLLFDMNTDG